MANATLITIVAHEADTGELRSLSLPLTGESSQQRKRLADIVGLEAFEKAETVDHGVGFPIKTFLFNVKNSPLTIRGGVGENFFDGLNTAIGDIEAFIGDDACALAFVSIE